tara:strand:+ start:551 stop:1054 length:504 start_codon:yes stop_codon:yes gene_type:complete
MVTKPRKKCSEMATKPRKRRKSMTKEQRAAAAERLAKARAAKGEPKNLSLHKDIRNLSDDHPISPAKVKKWLKTNKEALAAAKKDAKTDKKANARVGQLETYVTNMERYLRTGVWLDLFYGENQEHKVKRRVTTLAYDKDGNVKREVGVIYPDIGEYTREMYEWDNL